MAEISTPELHQKADAEARKGAFAEALRHAAEALRISPLDHRARVKVALCFAALGEPVLSVETLMVSARLLGRRGFMLAAIGCCRDALGIAPKSRAVKETLESLHVRFAGLEGRTKARVPPPIAPAAADSSGKDSLLAISDIKLLRQRAIEVATQDPDLESAEVEPAPVPLFSDLDRDTFVELVAALRYHKVPAGHTVVTQREPGDSLFILVHGAVEVKRRDENHKLQTLAVLGAGALFGEMSLLTKKARGATVVTTEPGELFEIDRETVEKLAQKHPSLSRDLVRFARRRLLMNLMATSPIFAPFSEEQRLSVVRAFQSKVAKPGEMLIKEGSEPCGLYLVLEGEVEVTMTDDGGDKVVLAYLREGEVFGEISLLQQAVTTANVVSTEKTVVLYLSKDKFDGLREEYPEVNNYLEKLSGERMSDNEEAMAAEGIVIEAEDLVFT